MLKLISLVLVSFFAFTALAQNEVPLPPPGGPGGGNPGTPQPPHQPPQRPPDQPPYQDPTEPNEPPSGNERTYTLGSAQTTRFASRSYSFAPRAGLSRIHRLQVVGTNRKVRIKSVHVYYNDGRDVQEVFALTGTLIAGQGRIAYLSGTRSVRQIVVTAANSGVWRKGGGFRVDASAIVGY